MSFSQLVKNELGHLTSKATHCQLVEVATIILYKSSVVFNGKDGYNVEIASDDKGIIRKYFTLFKKTFNIISDIKEIGEVYYLNIKGKENILDIYRSINLLQGEEIITSLLIPSDLLENTCCRRTYLRTIFFTNGSISNPKGGNHLEYVCTSKQQAEQLVQIMKDFSIEPGIISRKKNWIVYLKDGESISVLLNVMGAHKSLMEYENHRIMKEVRNSINRRVNCEAANISKTVTAANKQIADIKKLIEHDELSDLPGSLQEIAYARLEYPEISLTELGQYLTPPVGKSGVNHRLRKLSEKARLL